MEELVFFYPQGHEAHYQTGHPERPERIEAYRQALEAAGWWSTHPHLEAVQLPGEVLEAIHEPDYLDKLERACKEGGRIDMDTYVTPESWALALQAAGGAVAVADAVWRREAKRGFALTRPPGHHATPNRAMGFCLLNNAAIAAEHLLQKEGAKKLAIIDIDLHHGNGTQDIFYNRGDVFYFSTHQSPLYPGTGQLNETGTGDGEGTNANIPLPPGSGDRAMKAAINQVILPLLDRFAPGMLILSVGFDAHWCDPLGHLQVSAAGYCQAVADLTEWADRHCQGRIAITLEGGYDLDGGAACAAAATAALLGKPFEDTMGACPREEGHSWQSVIEEARLIWGLQ